MCAEQNNEDKPPFFIVGCPRSGTTLLQVLLDAHPDIAIPPESFIFQRFPPIWKCYGDLANDANLRLLAGDLLHDERIRDWGLAVSPDEFCRRLGGRSIRDAVSLLFQLYAAQKGKHRWGDKTPQHALFLKEITAVFPDAKFIHFVRDGRDVAESLSRVHIGPKSIRAIAAYWRKHVLAFHEFKKSLAPGTFIEPRYEDFVRDPASRQKLVFEFLGEKPPERQSGDRSLPDTDAKRHALSSVSHHGMLKGGISENKVAVYKARFSEREIEIFETVAGDALKLYGYQLSTAASARITPAEELSFFMTDHVFRYARKFARPRPFTHLSKELRLEWQQRTRAFLRKHRAASNT